jgi:hypothetical protein
MSLLHITGVAPPLLAVRVPACNPSKDETDGSARKINSEKDFVTLMGAPAVLALRIGSMMSGRLIYGGLQP